MREIKLTKGVSAIVSAIDYEVLSKFKWCASIQGKAKKYYAIRWSRVAEHGKGGVPYKIWMHRFIMDCPPSHVVDHVNGNGLDNRRENLRIVLYEENARYAADRTNSRPRNRSKYKVDDKDFSE